VIRFEQNQNLAPHKTFNLQQLSWASAAGVKGGRGPVSRTCPVLRLTDSTVQPLSCCLHSG